MLLSKNTKHDCFYKNQSTAGSVVITCCRLMQQLIEVSAYITNMAKLLPYKLQHQHSTTPRCKILNINKE